MSPARWRQIEDLFHEASELDTGHRASFLEQACGADTDLRREVESLLAADDGEVDRCIGAAAGDVLSSALPVPRQRIGPYEILKPIGEGGMGVVYLARRADDVYEQQVAIKIIRPAFAFRRAVERFRSERQILAQLTHPNIARLLDGGVTADGQPWFVMEYVEGQAIDSWCRENQASVRTIVELVRQVCSAVQSAHQNLIVHRDIKPANILVTADGSPRLLDFGVAKLLDAEADDDAARTRLTEHLLTPEYSSPEQILGKPATTATDVYGLGVLLYELLSGERPFRITTRSAGEMERLICTTEAPRPSTVARDRGLRGDLDNIVLKAMHKEAPRRYSSAAELSEDLRRYLEGFPVIARPDTVRYRTSRFIKRHRAAVAVAAALALMLVGFSVGMGVLARRASAQRDRAEQVSSFLVSLFNAADPDRLDAREVTAREMLDRGVQRVDGLASQPDVQSSLLDTFGLVYENLGALDRSRELLTRSLEIRRRTDPDSAEVAANLKNVAEILRKQFRYNEAEPMIRESIAIRTKLLGDRNPLTVESMNTLALLLHETGRLREAEQVFLKVLAVRDVLRERAHLETALLSNMGALYGDLGDLPQAHKYLAECVALRRRELGNNHPRLALALGKFARIQEREGDLAGARASLVESYSIRRASLGANHPDVARSLLGLAALAREHGDLDESERRLAEAAPLCTGSTGHVDLPSAFEFERGLTLAARGDGTAGAAALRRALDERRARLGPTHALVVRTEKALAAVARP